MKVYLLTSRVFLDLPYFTISKVTAKCTFAYKYFTSMPGTFARKEKFLCIFSKENSSQRKGCKESKEKYSLNFTIFGAFSY